MQNFFRACESVLLAERVLDKTQGATDLPTLLAGLRAVGTSFVSPSGHGPTDYRNRRDGNAAGALWSYRSDCNCVRYDSGPMKIG